jgi:hypothetical protein
VSLPKVDKSPQATPRRGVLRSRTWDSWLSIVSGLVSLVATVVPGFTALAIASFILVVVLVLWGIYARGRSARMSSADISFIVAVPAVAMVLIPVAFAWGARGADGSTQYSSPEQRGVDQQQAASQAPFPSTAAQDPDVRPSSSAPTTAAGVGVTSATIPDSGSLIAGPKSQTSGGMTTAVTEIGNEDCNGGRCGYVEMLNSNDTKLTFSFNPSNTIDQVYVIDAAGRQHKDVKLYGEGCDHSDYALIKAGEQRYPLRYCFKTEFEQKDKGTFAAGLITGGRQLVVQGIPSRT